MADFAAGVLTTAGSTTLPISSLYATAAVMPRIREIGIFNTATTAVALRLVRLTTTGTQGANLTEAALNPANPEAPVATAWGTHTVAPTLGNDLGYRCVLNGAAGAGVVWTWADYEFTVTAAANAGVGIIVENGTGQACQVYWRWTE